MNSAQHALVMMTEGAWTNATITMEHQDMDKVPSIEVRVASTILALVASAFPLTLITSTWAGAAQPTAQSTPAEKAEMKRDSQQKLQQVLTGSAIHPSSQFPANFPVGAYPNNVVKTNFIGATKGRPAAAAVIVTKDPPNTVFDWYQSACKKAGFNVQAHRPSPVGKAARADKTYVVNATKDKQQLYIFCMQDPKAAATRVSMSWELKK